MIEPKKLHHARINPVTLIGGDADGKRVSIPDDRGFLQMPAYMGSLQLYDSPVLRQDHFETQVYRPIKLIAGDWMFEIWCLEGMKDDEVILRLLNGYKPFVEPKVRLLEERRDPNE